jgi:hypothetical protein
MGCPCTCFLSASLAPAALARYIIVVFVSGAIEHRARYKHNNNETAVRWRAARETAVLAGRKDEFVIV